jgi:hypothetical protein
VLHPSGSQTAPSRFPLAAGLCPTRRILHLYIYSLFFSSAIYLALKMKAALLSETLESCEIFFIRLPTVSLFQVPLMNSQLKDMITGFRFIGRGKVVPKHHAMKTYWGEWRYSSTHSLTSALGGEWSASRPGRFTRRKRAPGTHWIGGWVGPRAGLDTVSCSRIAIL